MLAVNARRLLSWSLYTAFCLLGVIRTSAQIAAVGDGGPGPVKAPHLTAELVALGPAIAPGGTQELGLVLTMEDKWHVYWANAGDSGEPPHIHWTLPDGVTAADMQFPIPQRLPLGPLMDFGYEDEVAFPIEIKAAANLKPGPVHLDAKVDWLVCAQVCVPGKAHLGLDLNVQPGAPAVAQEPKVGALGEALGLLPQPLPKGGSVTVNGGAKQFVLTVKTGDKETDAEFYPYPDQGSTDLIANAADQDIQPLPDGVRVWVRRSPDLAALPKTIRGLVRVSDEVAYDISAPVIPGELPRPKPTNPLPAAAGDVTAWGAIVLAFAGGVILNLMPCVFPVLFLKGLALVQSSTASEDERGRSHLLQHGLVYALGILASFWAIVAALLVLRAGGHHAGWGFQLQSPTFLAVLASFLFFFALSLAGQFDIGLTLTSAGGGLAQREGYAGSFFTGVLATVVATPCTAPLMGAAVGFALAQTPLLTFAVFTALGLGLAAPYLLLSWQPAWVRILPKPGAWMETLKQFTAIPLFGTAIWLAWVYGQLYPAALGVSEIALLLACFLVLAIAGWALGRWPARRGSTLAAVVLVGLGLAIPISQARQAGHISASQTSAANQAGGTGQPVSGEAQVGSDGMLVWAPYSQAAIDSAQAGGHPVFIDFTAAWCLSCQVNERIVLKTAEVQKALRDHKFTLLKADWTNEDPDISAKLASVNRAGVPTYVVYPGAVGSRADVLPELLTKDLVLKAIERDGS
jgi:thiol:disulfide interchange protein/DsbC/DsbD-like thiol-disulfide interchange protein